MKDFLLRHAEEPNIFGDSAMDVAIDSGGHPIEIEGLNKLQMELLKTCLTGRVTIGDNKYGSTVPRLIGDKQYYAGGSFMQAVVAASIEATIEDYRRQQNIDVPDNEAVLKIEGVKVTRDAADATIIAVRALVGTKSGESVEVTHQLITS